MSDTTSAEPRRHFLQGLLGLLAAAAPLPVRADLPSPAASPASSAAGFTAGATLPPWTPGCLDIHHIATGRGNATLVILPDATSLLIDAGASTDGLETSAAPMPGAARRPGEWVGRYVQRHLRAAGRDTLDYLLVTHLHPDHTGTAEAGSPPSAQGPYRLSGVTDVAEMVPVGVLLDRGYPDYRYPVFAKGEYADNYRAFAHERARRGLGVQRVRPGSISQIAPRGHVAPPSGTPAFGVRNIAANGEVWSGAGEQAQAMFPPLSTLAPADYPNENVCSVALRLGYGNFAYFTAGDLTSYTEDGALPWRDVMTAAARAAGPADVATADHHGMFDGISAASVRALRPQAWVIQGWHISHPDQLQLERMFSTRLYPGAREVYATSLMHANYLANRRLVQRMRSTDGHIVVRVAPGGASFVVAVTDNADEQDRIKLASAPLAARAVAAAAG